MGHRIRLFVPAAFLIVVTCIPALSVLAIQETEVPPQLQPPVDEQLLLVLHLIAGLGIAHADSPDIHEEVVQVRITPAHHALRTRCNLASVMVLGTSNRLQIAGRIRSSVIVRR